MLTYNKLYKQNSNAWGKNINPLVKHALQYIKSGSVGLDLGCGQGKETFYLAQKGFKITAVDSSEVSVKQIKDKIAKSNIENIKIEQADICNYVIKEREYDFIVCLNLLHFLDKENIEKVINEIKKKNTNNGIVVISSFTDKDSSFKFDKKALKYYFKENELLNMFEDFECLDYFEGKIIDPGHAGKEEPHEHMIVSIVARKY